MSDSLLELSTQLMDTKSTITDLNAQLKILTATRIDLEIRLIGSMEAIGQDQIRNACGTFTLSKSTVPSEIDWETFHQWIYDNQMMHLLQRRISPKEYSDQIAMGEIIPGVTPFEKTTLRTLQRK